MMRVFSSSYPYALASTSLGLEVEEMGRAKGMSKWDRNHFEHCCQVYVEYLCSVMFAKRSYV